MARILRELHGEEALRQQSEGVVCKTVACWAEGRGSLGQLSAVPYSLEDVRNSWN